jgi:hypothetical protein
LDLTFSKINKKWGEKMLNSKMVKVTLRDIAKILVKNMPIEGQDFGLYLNTQKAG